MRGPGYPERSTTTGNVGIDSIRTYPFILPLSLSVDPPGPDDDPLTGARYALLGPMSTATLAVTNENIR